MFVIFQNLSPQTICGFQHSDGCLSLFLCSTSSTSQSLLEIKCMDAEKSKELLALGMGACVRLYNVKVPFSSTTKAISILLTATSGIRLDQQQQQQKHEISNQNLVPTTTTTISTRTTPTKWYCLVCNCLNKPSKGVCFSCQLPRRQGPSGPLWLFKGLRGPPYSYETWSCDSCFARKNYHFKDHCWKCGVDRSARKKRKQMLMRNAN